ncbi:hypothetical protein EMIHUDRAFT_465808 [Emiliania huxleyi CCMP1516]|uniref:Uncharacterized protein n=2 Tax=Emiliania huxleyi TaxID=2903 RepID=A0A0D3I6V0_EMIH1|nr:hypothetical protein EMIHUDRAFT_465808 [Emiliania huxleyi CCMP1516]EOD06985.1 hypothetical protein EMIHUDRAFT_465808 [Emiliania huxleyi CCMP1516]|eukprot:XP_005759414.1 hypothetical protein EMIHUDRAFT_465808 [Emiliania huxleyi CCMP1516]
MVTNAQTAWQALYTGEEVPQFETMQDFMAWAQTDPNQMRVRPGANNLPEGQPASALHWYERTGGGVLDGGSAFSPDAQAPQSRQQAPVTAAADPVSTDSPSFGERARGRDQLGRASVGLGLGGGVCPRGEPRQLDEQPALGGPHSAALAKGRASRRVPAALPQHAALTAPGRQPGGRRRREVAAHLTSFGGLGAAGFRPLCDCSLRRLWHRVAHRAADGECSPALPPTPPPGRGSGACCTPG